MEGASGLTFSPGPPEQPASNPASRTAGQIILRIRRSVTGQGRSRGFTRTLADECQCVGTGSPQLVETKRRVCAPSVADFEFCIADRQNRIGRLKGQIVKYGSWSSDGVFS
jgi:hypothetical protein